MVARPPLFRGIEKIKSWASELTRTLETEFLRIERQKQTRGWIHKLPGYPITGLPDPTEPYQMIVVTGDGGDEYIAISDGTEWLKLGGGTQSLFSEQIITQRTPIIELNSVYGLSNLRDVTTTAGTGSVSVTNGEFNLSTGATGSSTALLESAEYGRYMPGYGAEIGIGVRIPTAPTGNHHAIWGLYDGTDGIYFGMDATGLYAAYSSGGSETKVYSTSFSIDQLDGTGPSGYTFDASDGIIYNINFSWYGYGVIKWQLVLPINNTQRIFDVHSVKIDAAVSIQNPNLPIYAYVENGATASDFDIYVGGRQYSIIGEYRPVYRFTGETRTGVSTSTTIEPTVTFRRKTSNREKAVVVSGFDVLATTEDVIVELRVNEGLTGASYSTPTNYTASETALEVDTSATATDGNGEIVWTGFVAAGSTPTSVGFASVGGVGSKFFEVPREQPLTLCVRTLTGTGTVDVHLRMREEW